MIQIADVTGEIGSLCEGAIFTAEDKLGRIFRYRYEGTEKTLNGCDIHLHNLTDGTETYAEKAWFGQRKIKIV